MIIGNFELDFND